MIHRQNNVLKATGGLPDFAASYTVLACPVGAVASAASTGSTATVDAGHGFAAGDKVLIYDGTTATFVSQVLASVTATTLVWSSSTPTIAKSDLLVNLGVDTASGATPAYDASPMVIYSDADVTTVVTNSLLTTDTTGNYDYYSRGDGRNWELIRDSSGTVAGVVAGWSGVASRFNVADWGSAGDNSTDDQPRIQAAVTGSASLGGGEVFIPEGTHILGAVITMGNLVHLGGIGSASILKLKNSTAANMVSIDSTTDAKISCLQIDGNNGNQTGALSGIFGTTVVRFRLEGCYIHNQQERGIIIQHTSTDVIIDGNFFKNVGDGSFANAITLDGNGGTDIERCTVVNNIIDTPLLKGIGVVDANNCIFSNNTVLSPGNIGIEVQTSDHCVVSGNRIKNAAGTMGISIASTWVGVAVTGNVVEATSRGIEMAAGEYGTCSGNHITGGTDQGISVNAVKHCSINGNTINGFGNGNNTGGIRLYVQDSDACSYNTIVGNVIEAPTDDNVHGLQLFCNGATATMQYNMVANNIIHGANATGSVGLEVVNPGSGTLDNNVIKDNIIFNWATTANVTGQSLPVVASATTTTLPEFGDVISITGTTNITGITAAIDGRRVSLVCAASGLTISDGNNLLLVGDFVTDSANDCLTLVSDGTNWIEVSRSDVA